MDWGSISVLHTTSVWTYWVYICILPSTILVYYTNVCACGVVQWVCVCDFTTVRSWHLQAVPSGWGSGGAPWAEPEDPVQPWLALVPLCNSYTVHTQLAGLWLHLFHCTTCCMSVTLAPACIPSYVQVHGNTSSYTCVYLSFLSHGHTHLVWHIHTCT